MWLKHHYQLEWWASVLNTSPSEEKTRIYIAQIGSSLVPPSLSASTDKYRVHNGKIVTPLWAIRGLGENTVKELVTKGPFSSLEDYISRVSTKVNIGHFAALVKARAFDCFMDLSKPYPEARKEFLDKYRKMRKHSTFKEELYETDPLSVFFQEQSTNVAFNKTILSDLDLLKYCTSIWSCFRATGNATIPLLYNTVNKSGSPENVYILKGYNTALELFQKNNHVDKFGNDKTFGMILIFKGSTHKTGISKSQKEWHRVDITLSDGLNEFVAQQWKLKTALRLPLNCLVYVEMTLKEGYHCPLGINISEIREFKEGSI
jgi:hypothetical protein